MTEARTRRTSVPALALERAALGALFLGFIAQPGNAWDNNSTHLRITEHAVSAVNAAEPDLYGELAVFLPDIKEGARIEDFTRLYHTPTAGEDVDVFIVRKHFHNPATNRSIKGLFISQFTSPIYTSGPIGPFDDAVDRSASIFSQAVWLYNRGEKKDAYNALGHVLHLATQDMTQPAHTHDDPHLPSLMGLGDQETIETGLAQQNFDALFPAVPTPMEPANLSLPLTEDGVRGFGQEVSRLTYDTSRFSVTLNTNGKIASIAMPGNAQLHPVFVAGISDSPQFTLRFDHYELDGWQGPNPSPAVIYYVPSVRGDTLATFLKQDWWETPTVDGETPIGQPRVYFERQPDLTIGSGGLDSYFQRTLIPYSIGYSAGLLRAAARAFDDVAPAIRVRQVDANGIKIDDEGWGGKDIYIEAVDPSSSDPEGDSRWPVPSGIYKFEIKNKTTNQSIPAGTIEPGAASAKQSLTDLQDGKYEACAWDGTGHKKCSEFNVGTTPPTLEVESGEGVLPMYATTQDTWIKAVASVVSGRTPYQGMDVFRDGAFYFSTPAQTFSRQFDSDSWYWVRACDVASNCSVTAFWISAEDKEPPPPPDPPSTPPHGTQPPPPPPPAHYPKPVPRPGTPPCRLLGGNPAGSIAGCLPGGKNRFKLPRSPYLVPGDPNSIAGPEGPVTPGQLMTYTIEFENVGDGMAIGVYVKDFLDPALDDATLTVREMFRLEFSSGVAISTTPATFPWSYDPRTRTVTVLTGNSGPNHGGIFVVETRLRSDAAPGTVINNQALVYFPNALQQITPTNTVTSAVPLPTQLAYTGPSSGVYLSTAGLVARLTAGPSPISLQPVQFQLAGTSTTGTTDPSGFAAASSFLSTGAGNFSVGMNYGGDGFYYLPSAQNASFTIARRATELQAPFAIARATDTVKVTLALTDDRGVELLRQAEEPKSVILELLDENGAATPLATALVSGTSVHFAIPMPQPLKLSWPMRARFAGDSRYFAAVSTGILNLLDVVPPAVTITSPHGGEIFSGDGVINVSYGVADDADLHPTATAYLLSALTAEGGESIEVSTTNSIPISSLSPGTWTITVRASDWAGNYGAKTTASFLVTSDILAPQTELLSDSPSYGSSPIYVSSQTLLRLSALDDQSVLGDGHGVGVDRTQYAVDGGAFADYTAPFTVTAAGPHQVSFFSVDLAGHSESSRSAELYVDIAAPQTFLLIDGAPVMSTSTEAGATSLLSFSATDYASGVSRTLYAVDGATSESVAVSTFTLGVGAHTIIFRSVDNLGNTEPATSVALSIRSPDQTPPSLSLTPPDRSTSTTARPAIVAIYSDLDPGIDAASVRLSLDGVDVTSASAVTASSAAYVPPADLSQGTHTATAFVADFGGRASSGTATFLVDSFAPATVLLKNGLAAASTGVVLLSTDTLSFAASDAGTGVLETRYRVDASTVETVFTSPFGLPLGSHTLVYRSLDRAGNSEAPLSAGISVVGPSTDVDPPLVRLDYPGAGGAGIEQAIGGVVGVRGAISDASALTWKLEAAPGAGATSGFVQLAAGAGNISGQIFAWNTSAFGGYRTLRLSAADSFGNQSQTSQTVFVGNPVFSLSIGRKDSDVIVANLKNPTGIAVRADGNIWVAGTDDDKLVLITSTGAVLITAGDGGQGPRHFQNPQGLALDAAGNLYIADKGRDRIVKLSADGSTVLLDLCRKDGQGRPAQGTGPGEFKAPWDVAVDANGDIYAADSGNGRVQVFNAAGVFLRQFGPGVLPADSDIRGAALTTEGLWVSDKESERIYLFSRAGVLIKSIGDADSIVGEISRTRGVASDRHGALYVVEPNRDRTQKFDPQGKGLLAFGAKAQATPAEKAAKRYLTQPIDAAVAPDGALWITDTGKDRIVRYVLPVSGGFGVAELPPGGGGNSSPGDSEPAKRVVDARDGARVERDDGAAVTVPGGALSSDLEITVEKGDENQDKDQKTAKRLEKKVSAASGEVQYGPEGTTFAAPVTLTIPYDAAYVAAQGIKEESLKVYYWNPTLKDWEALSSTVDKAAKTVSAQTTHFSAYQVGGLGGIGVAAIDDFVFRDAYVFPNPSRDGAAVTFRIQPGSADSIEVRVYDVAGRRIHSSSDFRFLGAFDDGNGKGAQDTYDHVWNVSGVGSGVYSYVITAKKAGEKPIVKSGKTAVIR